ncbi:MAG: ATP-dependent Clp protease adaptor ClpS [Phycisphaerales bacterium]
MADGTGKKRPQRRAPTPGELAPAASSDQARGPWMWNVVLLNDQEHTHDYVIRMLQTIFAHGREHADVLAQEVDREGRAICLTTHKEHAELKCEQVLAFGRDPLVPRSKGAMRAIIEPAQAST